MENKNLIKGALMIPLKDDTLVLRKGVSKNRIWIGYESGEGGDFSIEDFISIVEQFYKERF